MFIKIFFLAVVSSFLYILLLIPDVKFEQSSHVTDDTQIVYDLEYLDAPVATGNLLYL